MPAGVVARAIAESHDTLCVCVGARVLLVLLFSSCLTLSTWTHTHTHREDYVTNIYHSCRTVEEEKEAITSIHILLLSHRGVYTERGKPTALHGWLCVWNFAQSYLSEKKPPWKQRNRGPFCVSHWRAAISNYLGGENNKRYSEELSGCWRGEKNKDFQRGDRQNIHIIEGST